MPEVGHPALNIRPPLTLDNTADLQRREERFEINHSMDPPRRSCILDRERLAIGLQISAVFHCAIGPWF